MPWRNSRDNGLSRLLQRMVMHPHLSLLRHPPPPPCLPIWLKLHRQKARVAMQAKVQVVALMPTNTTLDHHLLPWQLLEATYAV